MKTKKQNPFLTGSLPGGWRSLFGKALVFVFSALLFPNLVQAQVLGSANLCNSGSGPTTYDATTTTYTLSGTGACGYQAGTFDPNYYAAIDGTSGYGGDYQDAEICGACVAAHYGSNAVTVMIIDNCSTCTNSNQLDLGPVPFQALTGNTTGNYPVTWNFVPCPLSLMTGDSSGKIEYQWKSGCSATYDPIQFLDNLFPITGVSWGTSSTGPFTALQSDYNNVGGNAYWSNSGQNLNSTTGPFYFVLTDAQGGSVTLGPISEADCAVTHSASVQLPGCGATNTPGPTSTFTNTPGALTATPTSGGALTATPTSSGSTVVNGITFASCSSGNPSPGYSLSQNTVASGIGLDYAVAGGECGQPLTVTLPAGATPVTAYLYVEYDIGSDTGSLNNSAVGFGSNTTPAGVVDGAPVTWTVFQNIYYNIRYGINPSWITGGGGGGSQTTYTVNTSANPNTCKGESLMVLYTNPTETSMNYVSIADGNNAWHAEENNTITAGNGVAPPDAQLNWSCMNPSCSNSSLKFSSLGGRDNCNDGALDGDEDQIEAYGQGGVTCGQGSENGNGGGCGGPPNTLWSGPPGVLNCGGTNTPGDYDRTYNLGNFQGGATSLEWGFNMQEQNAKASFWQQALVSQYQCNPTQQCSVTQAFNQNFIQSGWVQGTVTFGQGPWGESSSGVSFSGGCNGKNNFLINTNVTSGPGTLQVSMCTNNNGGNFSGLVFGYNTTTGNGYGLQFYNNGSGNPGELLWVQYTGGGFLHP